jgi:hypothetical protein
MILGAASLWSDVWSRPGIWVDFVIIGVLGTIQVLTWVLGDWSTTDPDNKAGDGLRAATTGGLTVVGILIPVAIIVVPLASSTSNKPVPRNAEVDLFVASCWLLLSLFFGLYALFVAVTRAFATSPLRRKDIGITFGFQLIFLITGAERLVWGFYSLANSLIH